MSKIRKITASRKNRRENGIRADFRGSNPHSNGECFSRSGVIGWDIIMAAIKTAKEIIMAMSENKMA